MNLSFGFIPDLLMGKDPSKAFTDNAKQAAIAGLAMMTGGAGLAAGGAAGAGAAGGSGLLAGMGGGMAGPGLAGGSGLLAGGGASGAGLMAPAAGAAEGGGLYSLLGGAGQVPGASAASPGMFDGFMAGMDKYGKPINNALGAANSVKQMTQQPQAAPQQTVGVMKPGPDAFAGMMQQNQQMQQQRDQDAMQRRMRSNQMVRGLLGG